ncbi:hypothetical protein [Streptomyces sp. NPDC014995]|uniref:hypothetical protein n=1 Tax=Streptomyces sp. NPDC014995 TaxID=3364936 RepID=UPI003701EF84
MSGVSAAEGADDIQDTCHSGSTCVNVVGASTADLALLEQRTRGTAAGFPWSPG